MKPAWNITLVFVLLSAVAGAATSEQAARDGAAAQIRQGCCSPNGGEIERLHHVADRLYAQFKPREAAAELRKILRLDHHNFQALVKLARAHIDIGDSIPEDGADSRERKIKEYQQAEDYARRALKVDPGSTWGYFWVAAAVGNIAMVSPTARQIELAGEIRDHVEKALSLDPENGFAHHVYGVWHRKMAEIGVASRAIAPLIYGRSLPAGSLDKSIEYLKRAIAFNPTVIVSRLELARSLIAREEWEAARRWLRSALELPVQFSDDAKHKRAAERLLRDIQDR